MKEIVCTKKVFKVGNSLVITVTQEARLLDIKEGDIVEAVLRDKR